MVALPLFPPVTICQPPPACGVGAQGERAGTGQQMAGGISCRLPFAVLILHALPFLRPSANCSPLAVHCVGYAAATPLLAGLLRAASSCRRCVSNVNVVTPLESLWT